LGAHHPSRGIVTLSVGTDHIDMGAVKELGLSVENCPTFSSNSVAEHALALAFRGVYPGPAENLRGPLMFSGYSDDFAEPAVAHILMRARQLDESVRRARSYEYYRKDKPRYRHDEPWANEELRGASVGILGRERSAMRLARMLQDGFGCDIYGHDAPDALFDLGAVQMPISDILKGCDYIFVCSEKYAPRGPVPLPEVVDTLRLPMPEASLSRSEVAVLGAGSIGSKIARAARLGFDCDVTTFNRSVKEDLIAIGVRYTNSAEDAIRNADFIFVALPLNEGTRSLIGPASLSRLPPRTRVLVNVTRDRIVESEPLYSMLCSGGMLAYATDVLPNDAILWKGGEPDDMTKKFVQHQAVVATPHEGDCSKPALERLCNELNAKIKKILG
ncbi:MAG: NAD(P)-dependent oxidoreductase, partial [Candidatus Micrarchaeota archaeon]